ncbi:hypothetical protein [Metabacillus fastidiosus]|uniref:hypothetical protein n=1 Tax=Metabacillus fastidiosus TaxID=1458 RepID=UPI002E214BC5|nr:hypothetical protein [Metabacillus fastidiosus]
MATSQKDSYRETLHLIQWALITIHLLLVISWQQGLFLKKVELAVEQLSSNSINGVKNIGKQDVPKK